jgi:predicted glutamine amidotransferase
LRALKDDAYDAIEGSTDSEHLFGLFLDELDDPKGDVTTEQMVEALEGMFRRLDELLVEHDVKEHSYLNICVSNGRAVVGTRYTTNPRVQPSTLYYMYGKKYTCDEYRCFMEKDERESKAVILTSEPFTALKSDWIKVGRNSMIIVDEDLSIRFRDIEMSFERAGFVYQ